MIDPDCPKNPPSKSLMRTFFLPSHSISTQSDGFTRLLKKKTMKTNKSLQTIKYELNSRLLETQAMFFFFY